ncbi:MAG: hypothetical protein ACP5QK_11855 [Myxococcota bacterium]
MKKKFIILLCTAILLTLICGCPPKNMQLNESLFYFNNAYRWKRTDVSSDFVHPIYRQEILKALRSQEKKVNISDLEIEDTYIDKERGVALIKLRISYLMADETTLREENVSQYWVKDEDRWFFAGQTGSERIDIPIPDELKPRIFPERLDAGISDN